MTSHDDHKWADQDRANYYVENQQVLSDEHIVSVIGSHSLVLNLKNTSIQTTNSRDIVE